MHKEPYHLNCYKPDATAPSGRADDHLENHLLTEENRRLKDEPQRAPSTR